MKIKITREVLTKSKGNLEGSPFQLKDLPNAHTLMDELETAIVEATISNAKGKHNGGQNL
jgi:hypothetical protein